MLGYNEECLNIVMTTTFYAEAAAAEENNIARTKDATMETREWGENAVYKTSRRGV